MTTAGPHRQRPRITAEVALGLPLLAATDNPYLSPHLPHFTDGYCFRLGTPSHRHLTLHLEATRTTATIIDRRR